MFAVDKKRKLEQVEGISQSVDELYMENHDEKIDVKLHQIDINSK